MKLPKFLSLLCASCFMLVGVSAHAEYPEAITPNPTMEANINAVAADAGVQAILADLADQANADKRFETMVYLLHIQSSSREEHYRAEAVSKLFQSYIDEAKATANGTDPESAAQKAKVITLDTQGNYRYDLSEAGLNIVDGLPVFNACMEIQGTYNGGEGYSLNGQIIRPKVLFEGHIDSVNPKARTPSELAADPVGTKRYVPVYYQPFDDDVADTPEKLAALPQIEFKQNGWPDTTSTKYTWSDFLKRSKSDDDASAKGAYKIYANSINDMMVDTINVIETARLMLMHNVRPYYDLWICGTAGEEGRGNLDGMKQLYGYSQDGVKKDGTHDVALEGKANNALNFVANISTEGGITPNFLGSHRYQIEFIGKGGAAKDANKVANPAVAVAKAGACIAQLKTPSQDASVRTMYSDVTGDERRTTYTLAMAYADAEKPYVDGQIPAAVSIEMDMRSNNPNNVTIMDRQYHECFDAGVKAANDLVGAAEGSENAVHYETLWFGDRPAYSIPDDGIQTKPLIVAMNYAQIIAKNVLANAADQTEAADATGVKGAINLTRLDPVKSMFAAGSVNSNVPAAAGVPTTNIGYNWRVSEKVANHAYNEYAVMGDLNYSAVTMARALYTVFAMTGLKNGTTNVEPAYPNPVAPRTTDELFK